MPSSNVVIYARYSSDNQREESIEGQLRECRTYAERNDMKRILLAAICATVLTSCYNTRVIVGNVEKSEPLIEVSREWNHQLIYGLVPLNNATMKATEYVGDRENYVVRTYSSFLNGLVGSLTFGIYTPTSTVYYVPLKDIAPTHSVDVRNNEIIDLIEE